MGELLNITWVGEQSVICLPYQADHTILANGFINCDGTCPWLTYPGQICPVEFSLYNGSFCKFICSAKCCKTRCIVLHPFFKDVQGATDSTYPSSAPCSRLCHNCNWEGQVSQNVLAACTPDLQLCYVLEIGREVHQIVLSIPMQETVISRWPLGSSSLVMLAFLNVENCLYLLEESVITYRSGKRQHSGEFINNTCLGSVIDLF